jgi:Kinesin-associated protein (KAP)
MHPSLHCTDFSFSFSLSTLPSLSCPHPQNKDALKDTDIIAKISRFIPCSSTALVTISLRFLFNLSFDAVRALIISRTYAVLKY